MRPYTNMEVAGDEKVSKRCYSMRGRVNNQSTENQLRTYRENQKPSLSDHPSETEVELEERSMGTGALYKVKTSAIGMQAAGSALQAAADQQGPQLRREAG